MFPACAGTRPPSGPSKGGASPPLACWGGGGAGRISPYPYLAISRLPGRTWSHLERGATLEETARLLEGLGRAIASWHRLDRRSLAGSVPRRRTDVERYLATGLEDAAVGAAHQAPAPRGRANSWLRTWSPLPGWAPVLVPGDVNEGQILVDEGLRVTGVLDWETAHVGQSLKDFDLGEWGCGIFSWDARFHLPTQARMWEAYAGARGGRLPSWEAVHLAFCLSWARWSSPRAGATPGPRPAWEPPSTTSAPHLIPAPAERPGRGVEWGAGEMAGREADGRVAEDEVAAGVVVGRPQPGQLQVAPSAPRLAELSRSSSSALRSVESSA